MHENANIAFQVRTSTTDTYADSKSVLHHKLGLAIEVIRERPLPANYKWAAIFEWQKEVVAMLFAKFVALLWLSVMQGNTPFTFKSYMYNKVLRSYHVKKMGVDRRQWMIHTQQFLLNCSFIELHTTRTCLSIALISVSMCSASLEREGLDSFCL